MFWIAVILIFLLLFIAYLLWAPLELMVDTGIDQYEVRYGQLAAASLHGDTRWLLRIHLKALFYHRDFFPLKKRKPTKDKEKTKTKEVRKNSMLKDPALILRLLRTFEVKRFILDMDTGDCISNARCYPVFALFNFGGGNFNINFEGRNRLIFHLRNRPIRLLNSFIKPKKLLYGITF